MLFYRPGERYTITNDPEGFQQLYEQCGDTDLEVQMWRYYRLHNKGKTLLSIRCNGLVYGGSQRN